MIAQRLINDHMVFHGLKSYEINITNLKERSLQGLKSSRDLKIKEVNQQIEDVNRNTVQLQKI